MSPAKSIVGYLEDIVGDTYYFEFYLSQGNLVQSSGLSMEILLNSETRVFSIRLENQNGMLFPNYYYDIEILDHPAESTFYLDTTDNSDLYRALRGDLEQLLYVYPPALNQTVTTMVAENFANGKKLLDKLDSLKRSLLQVYIKGEVEEDEAESSRYSNSYKDWVAKKTRQKAELDTFLELEELEEENVSQFDAAIKEVIPNFQIHKYHKWDKISTDEPEMKEELLRRYRQLRKLLQTVKFYDDPNGNTDLVDVYRQLMDYDGVGEVAMSVLLNVINRKYFPIYARGLSKYMNMVGFGIETGDTLDKSQKTLLKYKNFQTGINQMFLSFSNYLREEQRDSYDAVNFYFRKKLDLFQL